MVYRSRIAAGCFFIAVLLVVCALFSFPIGTLNLSLAALGMIALGLFFLAWPASTP